MLNSKQINMQYSLLHEGLEAVKEVEDPIIKAKLIMGFNAASILLNDNMNAMDRMQKMLDGFIQACKTGKVLKEV